MKKKNTLYTKLLMFSYELEGNKILSAIKKGFLMIVPILYMGAIALVIKSFPLPAFQEFLKKLWDGGLLFFLNGIYDATYGLLSIYLAISISSSLGAQLFEKSPYTNGLSVLLTIICLAEALGLGSEEFTYRAFGNTGTFMAIAVAIMIPYLFSLIQKIMVNCRKGREPLNEKNMGMILIPFFLCIIIFFGLNTIIYQLSDHRNLNNILAGIFGYVFQSLGTTLFSGLLFLLVSDLLWFLGIHGGNALELVAQNIFAPMNTDPDMIISKSFLDIFGLMGGCGATTCLVMAILLFSRKREHRGLAKTSLPMVLFNVNEMIVFGLPIIFNPIMLIPFVLTPMIATTIAYLAVIKGFMPIPSVAVEWTTPIFLSGYVATGSIRGLLVQLYSFGCGIAVYFPFVKLMEKVEKEREEFLISEMERDYRQSQENGVEADLRDQRHVGHMMYNKMMVQLEHDIAEHRINMFYQPQIDRSGKLMGVEALLRWDYQGRRIFPPLVVVFAKRRGIMNELSLEILKQSCLDGKQIITQNPEFKISVNMVAEQLNEKEFVEDIIHIIQKYRMERNICLEITEETNMDCLESIRSNIELIRNQKIRFAMDDFSMGHTSLKYLQESLFDYVKLDGALVEEAMRNKRSEEIIYSIIKLGQTLQFKIIAEYVDTKGKEEKLIDLGCDYMQGYLYSPAVPMKELLEKAKIWGI